MTIFRYCGRDFNEEEMSTIRHLISTHPEANRAQLSRMVCDNLKWLRPGGGVKDMSCRVAMLRMQDDGLLNLPAPQRTNGNGKPSRRRTPQAEPEKDHIVLSSHELRDIKLDIVDGRKESLLWNEFIDRYHYLRYQPLRGDQIRYIVRAKNKIVALLGFGAAVWKTAPRDNHIGWTIQQRRDNIHLLINNIRFLILPWVCTKNLASRILSMTTRRIAVDWEDRYGYRPVLMETFVESRRFHGTAYKAANWKYLGETKGRGRLEMEQKALLPLKAIFVYPLVKDYLTHLCSD